MSTELQRQVAPQLCYKPATLKERATLQLAMTFACFEDGNDRIGNTALPEVLKNDMKATMKAITLWCDRHFWMLGEATICFLPSLHWKSDSIAEVDYEKTANMIVTNDALSATEIRFPVSAAYNYEIHELLWGFLSNELLGTNNWDYVLKFRALRLNAFQPIVGPSVNVPAGNSSNEQEEQ